MNKRLFTPLAFLFVFANPWSSPGTKSQSCAPLVEPVTVGCGQGVNINFTEPQPGELAMMRAAGLRWVRLDFKWDVTEFERGKYDFSYYERWLSNLDEVGLQALFILDYGNPLYENGAPPRTPATRQAFTNWAVAAARHFRGRRVIWELYNEPNHDLFWQPEPNANEYAALAISVGKAFQAQVPNEVLIGPALSEIDLKFLETCFKHGVLKYWSAVSVHPYKRGDPEGVATDYEALRSLIEKYAPPNKRQLPIVSSEWGYSTAWSGVGEKKQSELLTRSWLINLVHGVPLSIWYDWRDDGLDRRNPEHNFGMIQHSQPAGVFKPKPAYLAVKTFNQFFAGYSFERRIKLSSASDYLVRFRRGRDLSFALWTTDRPHKILTNIDDGLYERVDYLGNVLGKVRVESQQLNMAISSAPIFLRKQTFVKN